MGIASHLTSNEIFQQLVNKYADFHTQLIEEEEKNLYIFFSPFLIYSINSRHTYPTVYTAKYITAEHTLRCFSQAAATSFCFHLPHHHFTVFI